MSLLCRGHINLPRFVPILVYVPWCYIIKPWWCNPDTEQTSVNRGHHSGEKPRRGIFQNTPTCTSNISVCNLLVGKNPLYNCAMPLNYLDNEIMLKIMFHHLLNVYTLSALYLHNVEVQVNILAYNKIFGKTLFCTIVTKEVRNIYRR